MIFWEVVSSSRCVSHPSFTLHIHEFHDVCFRPALHMVAFEASESLKGRANGRVGAPGPLLESYKQGAPLAGGFLEKLAFDPGLEGC